MAEYYFRLPQITDLTISQQSALYETKQIALSGGPGTGKSVVSLWRHISNHQQNKKSLLLTYATSLAIYLKVCCASQSQEAAVNVGRSCKDRRRINDSWTEIIIDEAQDLSHQYYDPIIGFNVSYGADDSQILYSNKSTTQEELKKIFSENIDYVLDKNFRSTQRIMQFAKVAFPNAYIPQSIITGLASNIGELPVMLISGRNQWDDENGNFNISNSKQDKSIVQIINSFRSDTHNIAILVPYNKDVQAFELILKDNNIIDFSVYYRDTKRFPDGCEEIKNVHIATFKSAKGLEFDTVIIPNFDKQYAICGKRYKTEWNDYYVGVTRARSNLYLISSCDMLEFNLVTDRQLL